MKARAIVGKRVVAVHQQKVHTERGRSVAHVAAIEFEDGSRLCFAVAEAPADYAVTGTVWKNGKKIG